ncbi:MAG: hypothetical protein QXH24_06010 [Candidatus Bathyarchaeia archaeon]
MDVNLTMLEVKAFKAMSGTKHGCKRLPDLLASTVKLLMHTLLGYLIDDTLKGNKDLINLTHQKTHKVSYQTIA